MSPDAFDEQFQAARRRLEELAERAQGSAGEQSSLLGDLQELSRALEGLRVVAVGLRRQNEELAATRRSVEEERQRYRDLFASAPPSYLVTDPGGVIREGNRAAARLLGVRQEVLEGKPLLLYLAEEDRAALHDLLTKIQGAPVGEEWTYDLRIRVQPGEGAPFPAALTVGPVRDEMNRLTDLGWVLRDTTGERRIEGALQLSEEKWAKAFRASPDAITITTLADGRFIEVNDSFLRITGYNREEVIGRASRELGIWASPEDRDRMVRPLGKEGAMLGQEVEFRGKSGAHIIGLTSFEIIEIGGEQCVLSVVHDITQRKRVDIEREILLQVLQDSLARVKTLTGLLPICAWCKKIRDDEGYWTQVDKYITDHSEAHFTHGICPACASEQRRKASGGERV